jgi:hypothetical protein
MPRALNPPRRLLSRTSVKFGQAVEAIAGSRIRSQSGQRGLKSRDTSDTAQSEPSVSLELTALSRDQWIVVNLVDELGWSMPRVKVAVLEPLDFVGMLTHDVQKHVVHGPERRSSVHTPSHRHPRPPGEIPAIFITSRLEPQPRSQRRPHVMP